jgi:hypothetical protein
MTERHTAEEIDKRSGIHSVARDGGSGTYFEVTGVEGEHFPRTRSDKGAQYDHVHAALHSLKHNELCSGD